MSTFNAFVPDDLHDGLVLSFAQRTPAPSSRRRRWAGRVLSGLVVAFLLFDSGIKLLHHPAVASGASALGYAPSSMFGIGALLLACTVVYLIPRTSLLGALLITGYLGGAIATHVRVGNPLFSHTLFPVYVAALVWGGLYLRDGRVRALFAPRAPART
jgi:hypothetical protein